MPGPSPTAIATLHCRTFRNGQARGYLSCMAMGLLALSLATSLGLPPGLAAIAFATAVGLAMAWTAGPTTYTLTASHLERDHRRFLGGAPLREATPIASLRRYRRDRSLSRTLQEQEFLAFDLPDGRRWLATSRQDAAAFRSFATAFEALAAGGPAATPTVPGNPGVPRRGSFWRSWPGRASTLLALVASLGLIMATLAGQVHFGNLVRLLLVILPGTAWLLWRSFGRE